MQALLGFLKENPGKLAMFLGSDGKPATDDIAGARKKPSRLFR